MSRLARLRRLSGFERLMLLRALATLPAIALALRLVGLRRVQVALAWLAPAAGTRAPFDAPTDETASIARVVDIAARHGAWKVECLPRSLALQYLLRRRGIETALRVGVRKTSGALEAHAWLEHRGAPLIDGHGVHGLYAAFDDAIPPAPEAK